MCDGGAVAKNYNVAKTIGPAVGHVSRSPADVAAYAADLADAERPWETQALFQPDRRAGSAPQRDYAQFVNSPLKLRSSPNREDRCCL
ncbi:hypothetical protein GCM10027176_51380 [Actinoallomurus bryophytorum]